MSARKTSTQTARKPVVKNGSNLEDRIATLLHEKITTNQKNGDTIISDNTSVKLNMQKMFGIFGSLIVGVSVATAFWINNQNNVDTAIKTHDSRISSVEKTLKDMQELKTSVDKMQIQLQTVSTSLLEQKVVLDQQKANLEYIVQSMKPPQKVVDR